MRANCCLLVLLARTARKKKSNAMGNRKKIGRREDTSSSWFLLPSRDGLLANRSEGKKKKKRKSKLIIRKYTNYRERIKLFRPLERLRKLPNSISKARRVKNKRGIDDFEFQTASVHGRTNSSAINSSGTDRETARISY